MFTTLLAAISFVIALVAIVLMVRSTPEWTCSEIGSDWKCVGPTCNVDASKRFDQSRKPVKCERTDWAMATLAKLFNAILPKQDGNSAKPSA
jgi:hypothetical protein